MSHNGLTRDPNPGWEDKKVFTDRIRPAQQSVFDQSYRAIISKPDSWRPQEQILFSDLLFHTTDYGKILPKFSFDHAMDSGPQPLPASSIRLLVSLKETGLNVLRIDGIEQEGVHGGSAVICAMIPSILNANKVIALLNRIVQIYLCCQTQRLPLKRKERSELEALAKLTNKSDAWDTL